MKFKISTLGKYLISYGVLIAILVLGVFIFQFQIHGEFLERENNSYQKQVSTIRDNLDRILREITLTDFYLEQEEARNSLLYNSETSFKLNLASKLEEIKNSNALIDGIVAVDAEKEYYVSREFSAKITNQELYLAIGGSYEKINIDWNQDTYNKLFRQVINEKEYIFYVPQQNQVEERFNIYFLDTKELQLQLDQGVSELKTAMIDNVSQTIIFGECGDVDLLELYKNEGKSDKEATELVYFEQSDVSNYSIVSRLDKQYILEEVNRAFLTAYIAVSIIILFAIFFVTYALKITFVPLKNLRDQVGGEESNYIIDDLKKSFQHAKTKEEQLREKIETYRTSMQYNILGDMMLGIPKTDEESEMIDRCFNPEIDHCFFLLKIIVSDRGDIKNTLIQYLPQGVSIVQLEQAQDSVMILLDIAADMIEGIEELILLLEDFADTNACAVFVCGTTDEIKNISRMYEAMIKGAEGDILQGTVQKIANIQEKNGIEYPYQLIDGIHASLISMDWEQAKEEIKQILTFLNTKNIPDFFIKCVLVDLLTLIFNQLTTKNVKVNEFKENYIEVLYYCRSCDYSEKKIEIEQGIQLLIDVFQKNAETKNMQVKQIKQDIDQNCLESSFSLALIASKYDISIAYISALFKRSEKINISDYVWNKRLEKAMELLKETDWNVDDISKSVGYDTPSSFQRKFKQTMGITPTQYRKTISKI